jgi:TrmH family RNA methyltransferase
LTPVGLAGYKNLSPVTPEFIQSRQNPRVQNLARLHDRAHRDAQARFLIEGQRELTRALDRSLPLDEIFFCPEYFRDGTAQALLDRAAAAGIALCRLAPAAFDKASVREGPDGLLAVAPSWRRSLADLKLPAAPLLLVVEHVEKPGNLGALLRSADAAGAHAVIACDPVTDLFNPQVVRNSQGTLFSLSVVLADAAETLAFLRAHAFILVATTPAATADYWDIDLKGRIAVLVGGENAGLTDFWLNAANHSARIPMAGQADSLNVSAAASLLLYEAVRQRRVGK